MGVDALVPQGARESATMIFNMLDQINLVPECINADPLGNYMYPSKSVGWNITYPFPNYNGTAVVIWEWQSNSIPRFLMDIITSPC